MKDAVMRPAKPTEHLMQAWIYQEFWTTRNALLLALGISPDAGDAEEHLTPQKALLDRTIRDGIRSGSPEDWLWWGEKNGVSFHSDWWIAIMPRGPIGFDGQHFALQREEMLSDAYLQQERRLITKWARKPYWTPREAIDLSLNFDPFTTDSWRGEEPEFGDTIRERDDRLQMLERAVEAGDISEKASPKDYVRWLDKCGYIISKAWRRAVEAESKNHEKVDVDKFTALTGENAQLRRELAKQIAKGIEQEDMAQQLAALGEENENLRKRVLELTQETQKLGQRTPKSKSEDGEPEVITKLRKRIKLLSGKPANHNEVSAITRRVGLLEIALLAAAVDGHSYNPRVGKSPVPKQIADKTAELGQPMAAITVRAYLQESSAAHVEPHVWTEMYP
ncbi:hypothetical protein ACFSUD_14575 [Sulfitobacter aestuarii]|uniref:Uncharacterized protein n=1 Tax=Sulfitobacter aestuarii TaxID=2161676 RepID=A0ABW5U4I4_9RHOB